MITFGITGHRNISTSHELCEAIHAALRMILKNQDEKIRVVSPLAEGADQIFVNAIRRYFPCDLIVPIPIGVDEYQKDFTTSASRQEFRELLDSAAETIVFSEVENKEEAYLIAGEYVLEQSDILFALWDGEPARGIGGTGQIVELARKQRAPIVWIDPTRQPITTTYENFPIE